MISYDITTGYDITMISDVKLRQAMISQQQAIVYLQHYLRCGQST